MLDSAIVALARPILERTVGQADEGGRVPLGRSELQGVAVGTVR